LWDEAEILEASHWISLYKKHRQVIQFGNQYRLSKETMQYMSKDAEKGVLFVFQTDAAPHYSPKRIHLKGLNPEWKYQVEGFEEVLSGKEWMSRELIFNLTIYQSVLREIRCVI